jgi:hypothetical protein
MEPNCPRCHVLVRSTDYYCFNCGQNLHPQPPPTTITQQVLLYAGSVLLPPMGIIWGFRYLKQTDSKSKIIGLVAIVLTVVTLLIAIKLTFDIVNQASLQMNTQLQNLQSF